MNKHERAALVRDQHALAAMASAEASALRLNATFATINTTIRTGATTFATDFVDSLVKGHPDAIAADCGERVRQDPCGRGIKDPRDRRSKRLVRTG